MKNPIQRTKQGNVPISTKMEVKGQGTVPYPQIESAPTNPPAPKKRQEVRGKGAMLRATTYSVR